MMTLSELLAELRRHVGNVRKFVQYSQEAYAADDVVDTAKWYIYAFFHAELYMWDLLRLYRGEFQEDIWFDIWWDELIERWE